MVPLFVCVFYIQVEDTNMSIKNQSQKLQESFQFYLTHHDVVNMMNDPDVNLDNGNVDVNQVFEVWLQQANGSKIYLRDMNPSDTVMFQFVVISNTDSTASYSQIDVNP
jgi:hypothetical protein